MPPRRGADARSDVGAFLQGVRQSIGAVPWSGKTDPRWDGVHPCALVTVDARGFPSARTIVPRAYAEDLSTVRLATRMGTEKLADIARNPHVCLNFQDQRGRQGWVTIKGLARAGADGETVVVEVAEIRAMSYTEGVMLDAEGWEPACAVREGGGWRLKGRGEV